MSQMILFFMPICYDKTNEIVQLNISKFFKIHLQDGKPV